MALDVKSEDHDTVTQDDQSIHEFWRRQPTHDTKVTGIPHLCQSIQ